MVDQSPSDYSVGAYARFAVVVQLAVFTIRQNTLWVAIVPRNRVLKNPELPGDYIRNGESIDETAPEASK